MQTSETGVLLHEDYREALIIDKYDLELSRMRGNKIDLLRSENSEDAMTWNVFKSLKQINPDFWLKHLFHKTFDRSFNYYSENIDILLWKKLKPAANIEKEGPTEVNVIIESDEFIWAIEVKYKSDISMSTTYDASRDQIIRNIDVALHYGQNKDVYVSLLVLDEKHSKKGIAVMNQYQRAIESKMELPYIPADHLSRLKGIGFFQWTRILETLNMLPANVSEFERYISNQARDWLMKRIIKDGAVFDESRMYRYSLTRIWDPTKEKVVFICLNPSTADEMYNDNTVKKCIKFAKSWHGGKYGMIEMVNLFSYCGTEFYKIKHVNDPIGPETNDYIVDAAKSAGLVIVAWGENGTYKNRYKEVLSLLESENIEVHCLDVLRYGQPKHPLFANGRLEPTPYNWREIKFILT